MAGYLKIGDIKGESIDAAHPDWINLISVSQSLSRPMQSGISGSTRQRASVTCGDVVVTKEMDSSTPKLIEANCDGTVFKEVLIDVCTSTGGKQRVPYYQWKLEQVMVSSYDVSGQATDGGQFYETISLNFEKIAWTYDKMGKDGKSKGKVDATWDVEKGATS
ncbi:MAG: type VI secretion system tube protein Hcp [Pirellulaceae bacterium]